MAVYTKETALYDTGAISEAINQAGQANLYVTTVSGTTGVSVHDANDTNNLVNINSNGMTVYKGGTAASNKVASFGDTVVIGKPGNSRLSMDSNGITLISNDGTDEETMQLSTGGISIDPLYISASRVENQETDLVQLDSRIRVHNGLINGVMFPELRLRVDDDIAGEASCKLGIYNDNNNNYYGIDIDSTGRSVSLSVSDNTYGGANFRLSDSYIYSTRAPEVLWTGVSYMTNTQTASLSQNVDVQLSGIVLVWSRYANSAAQNDSWWYEFIPKWHTSVHNGGGVYMTTPTSNTSNVMCHKYIYVYNDRLTGHASNSATGTGYANNTRVLRAVLGV